MMMDKYKPWLKSAGIALVFMISVSLGFTLFFGALYFLVEYSSGVGFAIFAFVILFIILTLLIKEDRMYE